MLRKAIVLLFLVLPFKVLASDLVVTEIMYDVEGSDSGQEWIELYNLGQDNLVVTSTWRFYDSANHKINLYQGTSTIASGEFLILADNPENFLISYPDFSGNLFDTVISLPNSSSSLALSIDEGATYFLNEAYDSSWGANGNGYSLEKVDFYASSTQNWKESSILGGGPGQDNSEIIVEENIVSEEIVTYDYSSLLINEIMPNPEGSDDGEWIELYNSGSETINLNGVKIKDSSTRVFVLDNDTNLEGNSYLVLDKSLTGISLNNSGGDSVILLDHNDSVIDSLSYTNAFEGYSYARGDSTFFWTKTPSKGGVNIITINQKPIAQIAVGDSDFVVNEKINFSGEHSYDPEGEDLDYLWEFGDGHSSSRASIKHSFENLGTYIIRLTVTDSYGEFDVAEYSLTINQDKAEEAKDNEVEQKSKDIKIDVAEDDLIISEFMPNPEGSDDNEWIELYNSSDKDIDLYGWYLADSSKKWLVATSTIIHSQDYLVFNRQDTKITLNNSSDSVRLLTPAGDLWQEVEYQTIPEGKAYAFDSVNNEWAVTEASLGQLNIFPTEVIEEMAYNVSSIKDLAKNDFVLVQGVALNSVDKDARSLYLADYNFSQINFEEIVEIYSYYKNFPDINPGQLVTIKGQISKLDHLPRVKIKTAEDILVNDLKVNLIEPDITVLEDLDQDFLGTYLTVKGVVVKKSGKNIYLAPEEEEDYIVRAYTKFSTKNLDIKKGDEVIVTGLLSEANDVFKLEPFTVGAIAVSKQVLGEKIENSIKDSTEISTSTYNIKSEDSKNNVRNILIFIISCLLIVAIIFYIKKRSRLHS